MSGACGRDPHAELCQAVGRSISGTDQGGIEGCLGNDGTVRHRIWRQFIGDEWGAFDALPPAVRGRLREHAYDPWTVNALMLWRRFRRLHGQPQRAERAMLRYLDHCERLERRAFAAMYQARHGAPLPHDAANATIVRATAGLNPRRAATQDSCNTITP
jgi:hypothetical protein